VLQKHTPVDGHSHRVHVDLLEVFRVPMIELGRRKGEGVSSLESRKDAWDPSDALSEVTELDQVVFAQDKVGRLKVHVQNIVFM